MGKKEDIWYAVNITRVIHSPQQKIESFGATAIRYHLLSELMDDVDKVRLRAGCVYSERPQIITPSHFASQLLDGFGEKAKEYADWLTEHGEMIRILKYGLQFRKETEAERLISGSIDDVTEHVRQQVVSQDKDFSAVVIGADELWEVSLLKFVVDYIQQSVSLNFNQLTSRQSGSDTAARSEIEADFIAARTNRERIESLGKKLQDYGLFEEYEDRFYELVKRIC